MVQRASIKILVLPDCNAQLDVLARKEHWARSARPDSSAIQGYKDIGSSTTRHSAAGGGTGSCLLDIQRARSREIIGGVGGR